jgi:hypothetical protein
VVETELVAFLASTVVACNWRSNHAFVARLHHLHEAFLVRVRRGR